MSSAANNETATIFIMGRFFLILLAVGIAVLLGISAYIIMLP
jgi:hypothetical protein